MSNPWLNVPLADYEGHMRSDQVQQLDALSDLFAEALGLCQPTSLAVLGVAGGNGLDRIDPSVTKRIVGLDINPSYLDALRKRHAMLSGLELHCLDLAVTVANLEPVELVHAAMIFEHAGVGLCLDNALSLVADGGTLSSVLQLASDTEQNVGASPFPAMQSLGSHFSLVDPGWFRDTLERRNFGLIHETRRTLPAGKAFWMGVFRRESSRGLG